MPFALSSHVLPVLARVIRGTLPACLTHSLTQPPCSGLCWHRLFPPREPLLGLRVEQVVALPPGGRSGPAANADVVLSRSTNPHPTHMPSLRGFWEQCESHSQLRGGTQPGGPEGGGAGGEASPPPSARRKRQQASRGLGTDGAEAAASGAGDRTATEAAAARRSGQQEPDNSAAGTGPSFSPAKGRRRGQRSNPAMPQKGAPAGSVQAGAQQQQPAGSEGRRKGKRRREEGQDGAVRQGSRRALVLGDAEARDAAEAGRRAVQDEETEGEQAP